MNHITQRFATGTIACALLFLNLSGSSSGAEATNGTVELQEKELPPWLVSPCPRGQYLSLTGCQFDCDPAFVGVCPEDKVQTTCGCEDARTTKSLDTETTDTALFSEVGGSTPHNSALQ